MVWPHTFRAKFRKSTLKSNYPTPLKVANLLTSLQTAKTALIIMLFLLAGALVGLAQTMIYSQDFEAGTKLPTGRTKSGANAANLMTQHGINTQTAFGPSTSANASNPPFAPGNLAILSPDVGTSSETTFSIIEINPNTINQVSPVQVISINGTVGNPGNALRMGTSGTSGGFSTSSDGSILVFPGYNTTSSTGANTLQRGVGTLDNAGIFQMAAHTPGSVEIKRVA